MLPYLGAVFFSFFSLFLAARAGSSTGNSVLIVLQPDLKRDNFAIFFDNLESKLALLRSQAPHGLTGIQSKVMT
jgi:oligosaccharyltransferase complex subunit beta